MRYLPLLLLVGCGVNTEPILADPDSGAEVQNVDAGATAQLDGPVSETVADAAPPPRPDVAQRAEPDADDVAPPSPDAGVADIDAAPLPADAAPSPPDGGEVVPEACLGDGDCAATEWCNPCARASCPECEDCVPGCTAHECDSEPEPACDEARPDCDFAEVSVVRDGCWVCVREDTCEPEMACEADLDCGAPTCEQQGETCVGSTPVCVFGDHCEVAENPVANQFCREGTCQRCQPGDEVRWNCPDGNSVAWCRCDAGGILCRDDPSGDCAAED